MERKGSEAELLRSSRQENPQALRRECPCPHAAPLPRAVMPERQQAAASAWQDMSLRCVHAKGFLRAASPRRPLVVGCHKWARNSDLNIARESRLKKSSCCDKTSMTLRGLLPRVEAEGREGGEGSLDKAFDSEQAASRGRAAAHWH